VIFTSCAKIGVHTGGINAPSGEDFEVVFLFEKDGIQIYRFRDAGEYRYFSIGNGKFLPQDQSRTTSTGKTTTTKHWTDGADQGD
jgi:hypothetical protein